MGMRGISSELLPPNLLPVVDLVISAAGVVRHLLDHCPKEIVPKSTGKVCDTDYGIGQFYFEHVSMRKMIVLESLTLALHAFGQLTDCQHELGRHNVGIVKKGLSRLWIVPPAGTIGGPMTFHEECLYDLFVVLHFSLPSSRCLSYA